MGLKKKLGAKERLESLRSSKDARAQVMEGFLRHVRAGYSTDCYEEASISTIKMLLKDFPGEFDEEELLEAERAGKRGWEQIGRRQADGSCLGNSRSWYYNMSNRYGWSDRSKVEQENSGAITVTVTSFADSQGSDARKEATDS